VDNRIILSWSLFHMIKKKAKKIDIHQMLGKQIILSSILRLSPVSFFNMDILTITKKNSVQIEE
jgi:hypothetical protein